jgi:hypothetical protein
MIGLIGGRIGCLGKGWQGQAQGGQSAAGVQERGKEHEAASSLDRKR